MNYIQVYQRLETIEGVIEILSSYTVYFQEVDRLAEIFETNKLRDPRSIDEVLTSATALYARLNPIFSILEAKVSILKDKIANEKKVLGPGVGVTEFSMELLDYLKRAKNLLQSHTEIAEKFISTCQSKIKLLDKEKSCG